MSLVLLVLPVSLVLQVSQVLLVSQVSQVLLLPLRYLLPLVLLASLMQLLFLATVFVGPQGTLCFERLGTIRALNPDSILCPLVVGDCG